MSFVCISVATKWTRTFTSLASAGLALSPPMHNLCAATFNVRCNDHRATRQVQNSAVGVKMQWCIELTLHKRVSRSHMLKVCDGLMDAAQLLSERVRSWICSKFMNVFFLCVKFWFISFQFWIRSTHKMNADTRMISMVYVRWNDSGA